MTTTHHDNDHDDFSNVTWSDHVHDQAQRSAAAAAAEAPARAVEEAGNSSTQPLGREKLECTVGAPIKENDGTKDAFVSYLVTTHVCFVSDGRKQRTRLEVSYGGSPSLSVFDLHALSHLVIYPASSSSRSCRNNFQIARYL